MYGNFISRISENYGQKSFDDIEVGDGLTQFIHGDKKAWTVVEKFTGNVIAVTEDTSVRIDNNGICGEQSFSYETNWGGGRVYLCKDKSGNWKRVKRNTVSDSWNFAGDFRVSFRARDTYLSSAI